MPSVVRSMADRIPDPTRKGVMAHPASQMRPDVRVQKDVRLQLAQNSAKDWKQSIVDTPPGRHHTVVGL